MASFLDSDSEDETNKETAPPPKKRFGPKFVVTPDEAEQMSLVADIGAVKVGGESSAAKDHMLKQSSTFSSFDDDEDDDDSDDGEMQDFLQGEGGDDDDNNDAPNEASGTMRTGSGKLLRFLSDGGVLIKTRSEGEELEVPKEFASPPERLRVYRALCEVSGLRFPQLPLEQRLAMFETTVERVFEAGQDIIAQDENDGGFFIVTGPEDESEVQVWKKFSEETPEKMLTHLTFGACFGERGVFLHPRSAKPRSASVRAFSPKVNCVEVSPENFSFWQPFRISLILGEVPLLQKLPKKARDQMQNKLQFKIIKRGEFLFREGDIGDVRRLLQKTFWLLC